jgi:hypothetical protein
MKVKYIGRHKQVSNKYGIFDKDKLVEVDDKIALELVKSKEEFMLENGQPSGNIKKKEK